MRYYIQLLTKQKPIHLQAGSQADEALRTAIEKAQRRAAILYFGQLLTLLVAAAALIASYFAYKPLLLVLAPIVAFLTITLIIMTVRAPKYNGGKMSVGGVYHDYRK